jgi:hypothetical protein
MLALNDPGEGQSDYFYLVISIQFVQREPLQSALSKSKAIWPTVRVWEI